MKLRLTAFSISSIDMKTVMMLRRNRNPATPSTKSTALRIRYQERGTPVIEITILRMQDSGEPVGRTPWSAADALVGLCGRAREAGQGASCRPGGLPHQSAAERFPAKWSG